MTVSRETVTKVIDGDTFETSRHTVRLAHVHAPERGTEVGEKAARQLRGMIGGRSVEVNTLSHDNHGRAVARVKLNGKSVNLAMNRRLR